MLLRMRLAGTASMMRPPRILAGPPGPPSGAFVAVTSRDGIGDFIVLRLCEKMPLRLRTRWLRVRPSIRRQKQSLAHVLQGRFTSMTLIFSPVRIRTARA